MARQRVSLPALTSRRAVLLATGSAIALRPERAESAAASYLQRLLMRRDELQRVMVDFADEADRLRAEPCSPLLRKRLRALRRAELRASRVLERLEWTIADTPAESLGDAALKLRFCAELQGYDGSSGWRAPFTVEEQLLRTTIADLKRLNREQRE